jgi:hypothetical protein
MATIDKSINMRANAEDVIKNMGSGYGRVQSLYDEAAPLAGKKIGNALGQRNRANRKIGEANN